MAKDKTDSEASNPCTLLAALASAGPADLEAIRQEIARHDAELASLRQVEKILQVKISGAPVRKKPGPRAAKTGDGSPVKGGTITEKYRKDVAFVLLRRGTRRPAELAEECGIPGGSITAVLSHPWFLKNPDGSVSLTNAGKHENAA